jgi:phosphoribosylamine-glycine ligase
MPQEQLRILVVGNGGREHAFAWKLSQSPRVDIVYVAPGNGGTGLGGSSKIANANVKGNDYPGLVAFAQQNGVNLVVPGPEAPLVEGIQGYFQAGKSLRVKSSRKRSVDLSQLASNASVPPRLPPAWRALRPSPRTS